MTIEVAHLTKIYPGKTPVHAVRNISFHVERGEIFAFLALTARARPRQFAACSI
jgi:ABC-type Na+ transport system ATPase subunit NatA